VSTPACTPGTIRVAAIDCGTNSLRLLVADVDPAAGRLTDVDRRMQIVRLGQGVDSTGRLAPEALERTLRALSGYARIIRDRSADTVRMVATSATRDAANAADFVRGVIEVLGLGSKRGDYYKSLSGGQRQRLSVALALIGRPKVAVLDEMTTGLDPQARRDTWELIEGIRARGVTIVLVTHFMEEAERLCDRVALIDSGRVVALDTPAALAERARGGKTVRLLPSAPFDDRLLTGLPEVTGLEHTGQHVVVTGSGELVNAVILTLHAAGVTARDVQLDSSNLEDAFVKLTGRHQHKEEAMA